MSVVAALVDRTVLDGQADRVSAMLAVLRQFCPDGYRTLDRDECALGIAQLITAIPGRRSDGFFATANVCAVVDGRLDRAADLRVFLGLETEASDAEVIVAAYDRLGTDCVSRFRGDFAVVIWDGRSKTLVAARDTFGIRPLYYAVSEGRVAVASDPEQILAAGLVSAVPDDDMVVDYLLWDARFPDRTFFRDIKALPSGHVMVAGPDSLRVSGFRTSALNRVRLSSQAEYWGEYRQRFVAAVGACLESGSPVVAELSGGLDSSSIVCVADRLLAKTPAPCPSLVAAAGLYPDLPCDEEPFIRAVANHVRVPVQCWNATAVSVNELDPSSVALPGGRFATFAGTEGQIEIARGSNARVLLSGVGGDQIGTPWGGIRDAVTELRWRDAARMVFNRPGVNPRAVAATAWALARSFAPPRVRRAWSAVRPTERRPPWLSAWARTYPRPRPESELPVELGSEIVRRNWRSLTSGVHAAVMARTQHHGLRSGIETRFPFLDLDLVSIALSIPSEYWPPPWPYERLHREILKDWLPAEIVRRRSKANFEPAILLRVRRHLPFIRDLLATGDWKSERFVDLAGARELLATFEREKDPGFPVTYGLWTVATLEAWMHTISRYTTGPKAVVHDARSGKPRRPSNARADGYPPV